MLSRQSGLDEIALGQLLTYSTCKINVEMPSRMIKTTWSRVVNQLTIISTISLELRSWRLSEMEKSRQTAQSKLDLLETLSHSSDKRLIILSRKIQSVIRQQSRMLNEVDDLRKEFEEVKTALQDKINDLEEDKLVMRNHLEEVTRDWMDENILIRQLNSITITSRRRRD